MDVSKLIVPFLVTLNGNKSEQIAGTDDYQLTCAVMRMIDGEVLSYRWFRNYTLLNDQIKMNLEFSTLSENDSGVYICEGNVNSVAVNSSSLNLSVIGKLYTVVFHFTAI